jgi:hypothetical protein
MMEEAQWVTVVTVEAFEALSRVMVASDNSNLTNPCESFAMWWPVKSPSPKCRWSGLYFFRGFVDGDMCNTWCHGASLRMDVSTQQVRV